MSDNVSTHMDDAVSSGPTEQELLDAVMANSPIMEEVGVPLPDEDVNEVDPEESVEEADPDETEEAVSDDYDEEVEYEEEEAVDEDAAEEVATQEANAYELDDLDLDATVAIKIDGEEVNVSFGDLVKGYSTEQSLSKKGRELGEARKALDEERAQKLQELENTAAASMQMLMGPEESAAKRYHAIEQQIQKARADGDTYELAELKDKREQAQQQYWNIRNRREQLANQVEQQKQQEAEKIWQEQMSHFAETIPNLIPDFNEELAVQIRDFAIEEGIDQAVLDTVTDPTIIKFVDDYRRLKQGVKKGAAKRKVAPAKKALPTKKPPSKTQKKQSKEAQVKAKAFRENASQDDQMDFLRMHASKTLNNL